MTGEQRPTDHARGNGTQPPRPSLTDAYVAKLNAALGAGDEHLVIELADTYLDETRRGAETNASAA
ncbi:MAG: hypothetical protein ACRDV3_02660 [Acidothermaceae bacterium]